MLDEGEVVEDQVVGVEGGDDPSFTVKRKRTVKKTRERGAEGVSPEESKRIAGRRTKKPKRRTAIVRDKEDVERESKILSSVIKGKGNSFDYETPDYAGLSSLAQEAKKLDPQLVMAKRDLDVAERALESSKYVIEVLPVSNDELRVRSEEAIVEMSAAAEKESVIKGQVAEIDREINGLNETIHNELEVRKSEKIRSIEAERGKMSAELAKEKEAEAKISNDPTAMFRDTRLKQIKENITKIQEKDKALDQEFEAVAKSGAAELTTSFTGKAKIPMRVAEQKGREDKIKELQKEKDKLVGQLDEISAVKTKKSDEIQSLNQKTKENEDKIKEAKEGLPGQKKEHDLAREKVQGLQDQMNKVMQNMGDASKEIDRAEKAETADRLHTAHAEAFHGNSKADDIKRLKDQMGHLSKKDDRLETKVKALEEDKKKIVDVAKQIQVARGNGDQEGQKKLEEELEVFEARFDRGVDLVDAMVKKEMKEERDNQLASVDLALSLDNPKYKMKTKYDEEFKKISSAASPEVNPLSSDEVSAQKKFPAIYAQREKEELDKLQAESQKGVEREVERKVDLHIRLAKSDVDQKFKDKKAEINAAGKEKIEGVLQDSEAKINAVQSKRDGAIQGLGIAGGSRLEKEKKELELREEAAAEIDAIHEQKNAGVKEIREDLKQKVEAVGAEAKVLYQEQISPEKLKEIEDKVVQERLKADKEDLALVKQQVGEGLTSSYDIALLAENKEVEGKRQPVQDRLKPLNDLVSQCKSDEKKSEVMTQYISDAVDFHKDKDEKIDVEKVKDITRMVDASLAGQQVMVGDPKERKAQARKMVDMMVEASGATVEKKGVKDKVKEVIMSLRRKVSKVKSDDLADKIKKQLQEKRNVVRASSVPSVKSKGKGGPEVG